VDTARLHAARTPRGNGDLDALRNYAGLFDKGTAQEISYSRPRQDEIRARLTLADGQSIVVQESYDPAWRAWSDSKPLSLHPDAMGFIAIEAPPGEHNLLLRFVTPLETLIGRGLSAISLLTALFLIAKERR